MRSRKQTAFTFILIGLILWLAIAAVTGDGRLADWVLILSLLVGYFFSFRISRKESIALSKASVSKTFSIKNEKKVEPVTKVETHSRMPKELEENLPEIERTLSLLLSGTYGKLSPGAAESVRQVAEKVVQLEKTIVVEKPLAKEIENSTRLPQSSSIRNLKVS